MEGKDTETPQDAEMHQDGNEQSNTEGLYMVPVDILLLIKTTQNQNGLKQDDYYRYSRYCSRKVHRLRKATKFTQGRRKYVKNTITSENLDQVKNNQRAIQIPLFLAEREWSQAMFLKKQLTEQGDEFVRNKHTCRKRIKRAYQHAQDLFNLLNDCGYDSQTLIEAEAYVAFIKSALDLEYNKHQEALDSLLQVNIIYKRLAQSKDSLEAMIYQEKVDQIAPFLRLCTYNLGNPATDFTALEEKFDKDHNIQERITESMVGQRRTKVDEKVENITYQGKSIPLKTEKLKNSFQKLESTLDSLKSVEESESDLKSKVASHTNCLHAIEDCIVVIQKEKAEEAKRNEASSALYNLLLSYVNKIKQTSILERCLLKAFAYAEELPLAQVFTKQKLKGNARPQVIMKLLDKALRALKIISQDKASLDPVKMAEYEQREMIINIYLKFYIAVHYANEKQYSSTYAILKRTKDEYERCIEYADRNGISKDSKVQNDLKKLTQFAQTDIEYMICKSQAILMFEHQSKIDSMSKDFSTMDVKEGTNKHDDGTLNIMSWLFDSQGNLRSGASSSDQKVEFTDSNLNILETGGKNALIVEDSSNSDYQSLLNKKARLNKKTKLVELYPKFQPVMPKPFFFDLAVDAIEYPDLEGTIKDLQAKESSSGGLFGRIKGAFFG